MFESTLRTLVQGSAMPPPPCLCYSRSQRTETKDELLWPRDRKELRGGLDRVGLAPSPQQWRATRPALGG